MPIHTRTGNRERDEGGRALDFSGCPGFLLSFLLKNDHEEMLPGTKV